MKIVQVLPTLSAGGAEGFVTNLGVSLKNAGHEVQFFLLAGVRGERGKILFERLSDAGIKVVGNEERNIYLPTNLIRLTALIRSWKPDVVQANLPSVEIVCAIARLVASTCHTKWVRRLASTYSNPAIPFTNRFLDFSYDLTVACSPAAESMFKSRAGKSVQRALVTIPNGGHLMEASPGDKDKAKSKKRLGLTESSFVVTHIGRMSGKDRNESTLQSGAKAHDIVVKSFSQAFGGERDKYLVLVGDGPLRKDVEDLAEQRGISNQTLFLGQQAEPWPALIATDIFFFPSRWEGLPNVLPEAASCGLPVVASNIKEIRDIAPGESWIMKPVDDIDSFSDGLREVSKNIAKYRVTAESLVPAVREKFSMENCAKSFLEAYEFAINSNSQTATESKAKA